MNNNKKITLGKPTQGYHLGILLFLALCLFSGLFWLAQSHKIDFWWGMSFNLVFLLALTISFQPNVFLLFYEEIKRKRWGPLILGLISAGFLYGLFWLAKIISPLILPSATKNIEAIYAFKEGASCWRIALLMVLVIGPGEELFWRATIQRLLANLFSPLSGYLLATFIYTTVHLATGNPLLIGAALVAGLFWGGLYLWQGSILTIVVSHTLWDILVFLLFPLVN